MSRQVKIVVLLAAVAAIALVLHHKQRKKAGLSLAAYGRELLGIKELRAGRKQYLDLLRFLAVVLVLVVHTMNPAGARLMEVEENLLLAGEEVSRTELNLLWLLRNLVKGLGAAALSCNLLFVMISGALLLPFREEAPGVFYRKRFSRVLVPLVCYYLYYLLMSNGISLHLLSIWNGIKTIISGPNGFVPHFWMAYLLLGLYIAVPFQRWMLKGLPDSILRGMAAAAFGGAVFRIVLYLIGCEMPFSSILFSWEGIFYFGYFLTLPCSRKYDRWLLIGGGCSAVVIACLFCRWENAAAIAANYSPFTILTASAIFILFRKWEEKKGEKAISPVLSAFIQVGNKYSFSILLIHWFVLYILVEDKIGIRALMFGNYWVFAGVLAQLLTALAISFVFAFVYDQTVVFVAQMAWDKAAMLIGKPEKDKG